MESIIIKTTPGRMYSVLCSQECRISTESGIIIKSVGAGSQDFFIAPDAAVIASDASALVTECFNSAPFGLSAGWGAYEALIGANADGISALQGEVSDLAEGVDELRTEDAALSAASDAISEELEGLQSDCSSLESQLSEQASDLTMLATDVASIKYLPDWNNVTLVSSFPFTPSRMGMIYIDISSDSGSYIIYIKGGYFRTWSNDMLVTLILDAGDTISFSVAPTESLTRFIPFKN